MPDIGQPELTLLLDMCQSQYKVIKNHTSLQGYMGQAILQEKSTFLSQRNFSMRSHRLRHWFKQAGRAAQLPYSYLPNHSSTSINPKRFQLSFKQKWFILPELPISHISIN